MFHVYLPNGKNIWTRTFRDKRIMQFCSAPMIASKLRIKAVGFEGFRMAVHLEYSLLDRLRGVNARELRF